MKFPLLPLLCLALTACGQFGPSQKNQQNASALLGAVASGGCVPLQFPNGASGTGALTGFSACAGSDSSSVVIKYDLGSSGNPVCVYPGSGSSFSISPRCFTPSTPSSAITVQWPGLSFNSVAIVQQQNQSGFEMVGFGGISVPYVTAKFR